jgi:hypothetical protein
MNVFSIQKYVKNKLGLGAQTEVSSDSEHTSFIYCKKKKILLNFLI